MAQGTYKTGLLAYGYGLSMKPKGIGHFCIVYRLAGNRLLLNCTDGGLCAHRLVDYRQEGYRVGWELGVYGVGCWRLFKIF